MNVTFSRRRYSVRRCVPGVCEGAPPCRRHPCKMPALLLQDVIVTLDSNRAGSSMRLVRLKPQGPCPDRGPDRPVQRKFTK